MKFVGSEASGKIFSEDGINGGKGLFLLEYKLDYPEEKTSVDLTAFSETVLPS